MGDMADFANEVHENECELLDSFLCGHLSLSDAIDYGLTDGDDIMSKRIENTKKTNPTCNICGSQMAARNGRYGKFYYCSCPDQCTVSDRYWQSIKN